MSEESPVYGLTAAGAPRKRAPGAGRPKAPAGTTASAQVGFRVQAERKAAYEKAAGKAKLSAWAKAVLDKASGYKP